MGEGGALEHPYLHKGESVMQRAHSCFFSPVAEEPWEAMENI
jgi:hypothetical protein